MSGLVMIGGWLLCSAVVCHAMAVEMTAFDVKWAAASAVEQATASAVAGAAASVAWAMASAAECDIHVEWTGVEKVFCGQLCSAICIRCCVRIDCVKVAAGLKCGVDTFGCINCLAVLVAVCACISGTL